MALPNHQQKGYVRRALKKKAPQIIESVKTAMLIKGQKTSMTIKEVLGDIAKLKAPSVVKYNKRNPVRPFEDASSIEHFSERNDATLVAMGSHSAKRPDNLTLGRLFNHKMLDMVEFTVENFKSMQSFKEPKHNLASRTSVIFQGDEFENSEDYKLIGNILLDFFVEQPTDFVNLQCLDHVLVFTSLAGKILVRHYSVILKKSGSRIPRIELAEIGPSMDLKIGRNRWAKPDLRAQANTHHRVPKSKSKKNISKNELADEVGNVHIPQQNIHELQIKKPKALRHQKNKREEGEGAEQQPERDNKRRRKEKQDE